MKSHISPIKENEWGYKSENDDESSPAATHFPLKEKAVMIAALLMGAFMGIIKTSALNQLPPKWYAHGSALANTLQQISASIGTAGSTVLAVIAFLLSLFLPSPQKEKTIVAKNQG